MSPQRQGIRRELANIREGLRDTKKAQAVLQAASVLATFDLFALAGDPDGNNQFAALLDASDPASTDPGHWALKLSHRRRALSTLGTRKNILAVLAKQRPTPDLSVQAAFETFIDGVSEKDLSQLSATILAGMLEALDWVEGILPELPVRAQLERALARARQLEPLRQLVGDHFQGREHELAQLWDYVFSPSTNRIVFLHGPGGIGKSTILAKFALDVTASAEIDAFAYLNLDRPLLKPNEPLTLARDVVLQLVNQFPGQREALEQVARDFADIMRRSDREAIQKSNLETISSYGADMFGLASVLRELPGKRPILVLIDTFEQAQKYGLDVVDEVWRQFHQLAGEVDRLRIIGAGRVGESSEALEPIALDCFERDTVAAILQSKLDEPLANELVDDFYRLTKGHPLTVHLASILLGREGADAFIKDPEQRNKLLKEFKSDQVNALLFDRVLRQISNKSNYSPVFLEKLEKIVMPGLVMRRIYEDAISDVLAQPCQLNLEHGEARSLFDAMRREVDLVTLDYSDPAGPALVHRADVRAMILQELRARNRQLVAEIDQEAIAFFASRSGPIARAEELYHRLWADEPRGQILVRWTEEAGERLISSVDELPVRIQPWVAQQLRISLPVEILDQASNEDWEENVAQEARARLARGDAKGALRKLWARESRVAGSQLFAIEAEALRRLSRVDEAMAILDAGLTNASRAGAQSAMIELYITRALLRERERRFAAAAQDAASALELADQLHEPELQLRGIAALLRLARKTRNVAGPTPAELIVKAKRILNRRSLEWLVKNPTLMRELAAELGAHHPELLVLTYEIAGPSGRLKGQRSEKATAATDQIKKQIDKLPKEVIALSRAQESSDLAKLAGHFERMLERAGTVADKIDVLKPAASLLAAEIDELHGAFPSASMSQRSQGWRTPSTDEVEEPIDFVS